MFLPRGNAKSSFFSGQTTKRGGGRVKAEPLRKKKILNSRIKIKKKPEGVKVLMIGPLKNIFVCGFPIGYSEVYCHILDR